MQHDHEHFKGSSLQFGNIVKLNDLNLLNRFLADFEVNRFDALKHCSQSRNIGNRVNGAGKR